MTTSQPIPVETSEVTPPRAGGRRLRLLLRVVLGVLGAALLAALVAWALVREGTPAVPLEGSVDHRDALDLRAIVAEVDPRTLEYGALAELTLRQEQVDALAAEASRRLPFASGRVTLRDGAAAVVGTVKSPWPWVAPFLNVRATLRGQPDAIELHDVRLGKLPVPRALAQRAFDEAYARAMRWERLATLVGAVEDVQLRDGQVGVQFVWNERLHDELRGTGRALVMRDLGADRLRAAIEDLRRAVAAQPGDGPIPLSALLPGVFAGAAARAEAGAPAAELKAALLVLTFYGLDRPFDPLFEAEPPARVPHRPIELRERGDLALHFLVSALLTVYGDRAFADALGLSKEITDSQGGSGFSFADLTADRAGTKLVERATTSDARLRAVLARLGRPLEEGDLLPLVGDLPEGMDEATFAATYSAVGSAPYEALVATIDARIDETTVQRVASGR